MQKFLILSIEKSFMSMSTSFRAGITAAAAAGLASVSVVVFEPERLLTAENRGRKFSEASVPGRSRSKRLPPI